VCLCDLFQISAQLKNIRIFDIYFSVPGRCLTHGAADPRRLLYRQNLSNRILSAENPMHVDRLCVYRGRWTGSRKGYGNNTW